MFESARRLNRWWPWRWPGRYGSPATAGLPAPEAPPPQPRLAILIDADNATHRVIDPLLAAIEPYGRACIRRIYGDWGTQEQRRWQPLLNRHGIVVVHQPRHAGRYNATDIALTIDAMDLVHARAVDGMCLVSSDADFTRLACRVREGGLLVFGCGNRDTPAMLIAACDRFFLHEELLAQAVPQQAVNGEHCEGSTTASQIELAEWLIETYESLRRRRGEPISLAEYGQALHDVNPGFDPRRFGHRRLSSLLQASGLFRLRTMPSQNRGGTVTRLCRRDETDLPGM